MQLSLIVIWMNIELISTKLVWFITELFIPVQNPLLVVMINVNLSTKIALFWGCPIIIFRTILAEFFLGKWIFKWLVLCETGGHPRSTDPCES